MAESMYRKAAIDRLASPERLDAPLTLVGRPAWLLLAGFAAAIVVGLVWASITQAPVKVESKGILIDRTGLAEIVAGEDGRIERLLAAPGDRVSAGQPIAAVARPELRRDIAEARSKLADAQARYNSLQGFYGQQGARQQGADAARLAGLAETRKALTERVAYLEKKAASQARLVDQGFLARDKMVDTQIELAGVRERIANLGEDTLKVGIDATARTGERRLALLDQQRIIQEQSRAIEILTARLADQQMIRSPHAGRITELKVNAGDVVTPGAALATVAPDDDGRSLVALLYVPASEGKRVEPGMTAEIVPSTVERAVYGHIPGRILSVAPLPATPEGMRRILQNGQLVTELTAGGAPIEVRVALTRDPRNPSGFAWSSSHGPKARISAGSIVRGRVVVDRKRVIAWLIPRAAGT